MKDGFNIDKVKGTLIVLAFVILALQNLDVELLPLIAGLGVAGAGIALAMQGVLSNVVAGLTIIFTKPYRVGEYISVVGVEGQVHTIIAVVGELNLSLVEELHRRGIGIPCPQREIRMLAA